MFLLGYNFLTFSKHLLLPHRLQVPLLDPIYFGTHLDNALKAALVFYRQTTDQQTKAKVKILSIKD